MFTPAKSGTSLTPQVATSTTDSPHGTASATVFRDELILEWIATNPTGFQRKVLDRLILNETGCRLWPGAKGGGYGEVRLPVHQAEQLKSTNKSVRVHRSVYLWRYGAIPYGYVVDHDSPEFGCGNKLCAEPTHLVAVSTRTNTVDRGKGTAGLNAIKTACPRCSGTFTLDNDGRRYCHPCRAVLLQSSSRRTNELTSEAHKKLGITQREYKRRFAHSAPIAQQVIQMLDSGSTPEEVLRKLGRMV